MCLKKLDGFKKDDEILKYLNNGDVEGFYKTTLGGNLIILLLNNLIFCIFYCSPPAQRLLLNI